MQEKSKWARNLTESQVEFVQEIIEQVPKAHGIQDAFVQALNDIGSQWKYLIVNDDQEVTGTDDAELCQHLEDGDFQIIDLAAHIEEQPNVQGDK